MKKNYKYDRPSDPQVTVLYLFSCPYHSKNKTQFLFFFGNSFLLTFSLHVGCEVLCTSVKLQKMKMLIDFTSLQRDILGLLIFVFQLVKTNKAEKVKIPDLNIIC